MDLTCGILISSEEDRCSKGLLTRRCYVLCSRRFWRPWNQAPSWTPELRPLPRSPAAPASPGCRPLLCCFIQTMTMTTDPQVPPPRAPRSKAAPATRCQTHLWAPSNAMSPNQASERHRRHVPTSAQVGRVAFFFKGTADFCYRLFSWAVYRCTSISEVYDWLLQSKEKPLQCHGA